MITVDFNRIDLPSSPRILDIGCGSGRHTAAAYMLEGAKVVGADLNMADLCKAKGRLQFHDDLGEHGGGDWGLAKADITCLPFPDNWFDLVICSEVMEHIPAEAAAMAELTRVLKPGRKMVVSVPRRLPERICWALSREYRSSPGGHIRVYEKTELIEKLSCQGLTVECHHYAHSIHTPYWWLKCLVGIERTDSAAVNLYHRLLSWDIMEKPPVTRLVDRLMNPILGKSLVLYLEKKAA